MLNVRTSVLLGIGLVGSLWLQSCSQSSQPTAVSVNDQGKLQGKIVLTGSSTVAPLATEIGKQFEQNNPGVRVDVQSGGSSRGIADARSGVADLGMISRSLDPDEADLKAFPIALDGIAMIVHESNPISELSKGQIEQIYQGDVDNWQAVGGEAQPITVVNKAEGRSTLELFLKYLDLEAADIKADVVIGDNEQGIKTVAGNESAVGYVSIGSAENSIEQGVPIKLVKIDGIEASTATVKEGKFPISRELNLVTLNEPTAEVGAFIDFAQSPEAYEIIERQYFVPITK
ncbi:MAG: ABC transporter substrate-binding protein [Leptolyngbya foveolarum]|uniref:ABC transporter substrate-binding protein n=1 Tax=Leptolyngbya foveolarum TaxID=47253 RepID=A0A2W4TTI8_9CYAN|nr:MAG: ABC transporter substrate-binding protein [Leptolyngbya foveolarum]